MATNMPNPEDLERAAGAIRELTAAEQERLAREAEANNARAVEQTADGNARNALGKVGVTVAGNSGAVYRRSSGFIGGFPGGWFGVFVGALAAIAVIALILALCGRYETFYLANNKADVSRVESVDNRTVAAGNQAAENKGKISVLQDNTANNTDVSTRALVKAEVADTNAGHANAKVDKLDEQIKVYRWKHQHQQRSTSQVVQPVAQAPLSTGNVGVANQNLGNIWYWRENQATDANPGKCVFSAGNGEGKPPFCATFTTVSPKAGESKNEWISRVGGGGRLALDSSTYQKK